MLKPLAILLVATAASVVLVGCSTAPRDNASDGELNIVASTNVYGDLANTLAGGAATVTSLIDKSDEDPHEFAASGRDQLALSRADIVIVNGGGYDDFATQMLAASGNTTARVIDAVKLSGYDASSAGFNEHVFYDYPTMVTVVKAIAAALDIAEPDSSVAFDARATALEAQISALTQLEQSLTSVVNGAGVLITEPVPLYLLDACGFHNLTPPELSAAIENGDDVAPALLKGVLSHLSDGSARLVVYNAQTGGPQTDALVDAASDAGVTAIGVTETLPENLHYFEWQKKLLTDITAAMLPA